MQTITIPLWFSRRSGSVQKAYSQLLTVKLHWTSLGKSVPSAVHLKMFYIFWNSFSITSQLCTLIPLLLDQLLTCYFRVSESICTSKSKSLRWVHCYPYYPPKMPLALSSLKRPSKVTLSVLDVPATPISSDRIYYIKQGRSTIYIYGRNHLPSQGQCPVTLSFKADSCWPTPQQTPLRLQRR